jgi:carboxylate-amine ligase
MKFHSSPNPTIGVEIELQLIDDNTQDLKNISPRILADIDKNFSNRIKHELFESMIEINTDVCNTVEEVNQDIKQTLLHLEDILKNYNASMNCSSLHPFAKGKNQIITNNERYKRIMKDLQIIGTRFITQGLHVHIGVDDCEKAIKVNNAIRMYLPLLLALTTSSPYYEGEDTGLHSYRTKFLNLCH